MAVGAASRAPNMQASPRPESPEFVSDTEEPVAAAKECSYKNRLLGLQTQTPSNSPIGAEQVFGTNWSL